MFGRFENHLSEKAKDFLPCQKVGRLKTIIRREAQEIHQIYECANQSFT